MGSGVPVGSGVTVMEGEDIGVGGMAVGSVVGASAAIVVGRAFGTLAPAGAGFLGPFTRATGNDGLTA